MRGRLVWLATSTVVALALAFVAAPAASAEDSVTPLCNGQPCTIGWYTTPVAVTWQVSTSPAPDRTIDCAGVQPTSHDLSATTSCEAIWTGVDDIKRAYTVHVELSAPTATASPDRAPDSNGWYNHPVTVSFAGNSFSGIGSCTQPLTYAGPSGAEAIVNGACTDNAGKTGSTSISLKYDASPPIIIGATPSRSPDAGGYYTHPVTFRFKGIDAMSGIASCDTVTYRGSPAGQVVGGCRDLAGNYATISVSVRYRRTAPRAAATRSGSRMVLRWRKAARASYYNVQIYRGGRKILSSWPARTSLVLHRSWIFAGHRFRLKPGRYRWYVWPGYGSRTRARYGRMLVTSTFRVVKRS